MTTSNHPPGAVVKLAIRAVALIFIVFAIVGVAIAANSLLLERRVASWPSVEGKIIEATAYHRTGVGRRSRSSHGVHVKYSYKVNGAAFTGNRYYLTTNSFGSATGADDAVRKLPAGSSTNVFYDPKDPARCCLARETASTNWIVLAICLVTLLVALGFFALASRIKPTPD